MNIAVRGIGIVSAIGMNGSETLDSLRRQRTGISEMQYLASTHHELPVGEVKRSNEELKALLGLDAGAMVSRTTLLGAVAVRQALQDAGYMDAGFSLTDSIRGKRVVLISGTTVGGMDLTEGLFDRMQEDDGTLEYVRKHDCGSSTDEIARICHITGETCTISTACSSAVNSIIVGSEMLLSGEADVVIAGGAEALSMFHLNGFHSLLILDHEQCRPFDATRAGLNLGEGAAFVVLERNAGNALAYIGGYGNACDAFHQTASSDNGEGAYRAMAQAIGMSGKGADDIHYVNAHGTGTPNNDVSEGVALKRVFGDRMPPVSSTKAFTGHTTSASGSIETVICLLAMRERFIPANLNWKNRIVGGISPSMGEEGVVIDNVLCNSFGFGGNDSSVMLCRDAVELHGLESGKAGSAADWQGDTVCRVVADVTISDVEQLRDSREFIPPMEGRRMGKLMKAATLTSLKALKEAGIAVPDAIISATAYGMLETSEKFLRDMCENGEGSLSPTLFMQSTHNTIGSAIAIRTKCHGYNITYTQGARSLEWAMRDARRLIASGRAETVLVGLHDEATPLFQSFCERLGDEVPPTVYSRSIVLTNGKWKMENRNRKSGDSESQ